MQRKDELGNFLGETSCAPGGWSKEPRERNLELELSMMQFELLSLKQKIQDLPVSNALTQALTPSNSANVHLVFEIASDSLPFLHQMQSSFAYLEKEKMWLEMARYEDRKQKGNLDDKSKKKDVEQKLISLQESSVVLQKCIKALEKERDEMAEKIKSAEEEKVALHQQVQQLTLELAGAQKKQEVFSDQTLALHSELVSVKTQVNLQEQEKVVMKEELESTRQMNQELSSEVAESCQRLGASLEKLHHLEAENNILNNRIQSLENERTQLLREIEGRPHERQMNGRSQQENVAALQESCECLRESQSVLQSEKDSLQTRCLELEAALQQKQEEMVNHLMQQQQQVSQYWRGRWEEVTATPNAKEEELEKTPLQNQTLSAKVAEMEAAQGPSNPRPNQALQILKGQKNGSVPSKDSRSCGACSHCAAALLQLNQLIQNCAEKSSGKQEEEATLTYLYQVQDLLKGKVQDQNPVSIPGRRETQKPDAKVSKSPQEAQENLRQQQQLVTEQLKELFRQRKLLKEAGCKKQPGGPKTEGLVETPKLQEALAMPESIGLAKEGQPEALAAPGNGGEVQSLQQQLKEKTETINSMASEIQALQEKNENLMKAKMRFQQQIQEIRKLPKQWQEKSNMEPLDPKPATSLGQDLQSAQWSDSSALSPQSDDTAFFSHSQEDLHMAMQQQNAAGGFLIAAADQAASTYFSPPGLILRAVQVPLC
ncbi:early endosome antigen 1-like [Tiliqua scincoides]|uniref:early endosome antigen 1-like n=1 Tax=Tiliqua scincoides TaxID=71010 RepID=UPI003461BD58